MGQISLRRRLEPSLQVEIYEARLDDEFLMSSLFTAAETELATRALAALAGDELDIVVGGLGLGYTAAAVLADRRVRALHVVEALDEVIDWHRRDLLPLSETLTSDDRCHLVCADFFAAIAADAPIGDTPQLFHAILVDIDHSPCRHLDPTHAGFYTRDGLRQVSFRLHAGGVFGLWSDDPPDTSFLEVLDDVFASASAHVVTFPNPYTGGNSSSTVYLAHAAG